MNTKWINLPDKQYVDDLIVHEVKCPVCGYKETFHTDPHEKCFMCETKLAYERNNGNGIT